MVVVGQRHGEQRMLVDWRAKLRLSGQRVAEQCESSGGDGGGSGSSIKKKGRGEERVTKERISSANARFAEQPLLFAFLARRSSYKTQHQERRLKPACTHISPQL